jgi:hypothetical protein
MPGLRLNPNLVKRNRSYTVGELAARLNVHKNTVRNWQREGLTPIDERRPVLFQGDAIRAFLANRNARRKCSCPPGTFYCFGCRGPRPPALGMVDYLEGKPGLGNLRALCETCEAVMHRRARRSALSAVMPGISIRIVEAVPRLVGSPGPSLNSDSERQGAP